MKNKMSSSKKSKSLQTVLNKKKEKFKEILKNLRSKLKKGQKILRYLPNANSSRDYLCLIIANPDTDMFYTETGGIYFVNVEIFIYIPYLKKDGYTIIPENDWDYINLYEHYKAQKIFIGKHRKSSYPQDSRDLRAYSLGNTLLLKIKKNKYVFIEGYQISGFGTYNDEIIEYFSVLGNYDIPYPVAFGKKNVYFILDNYYIPRKFFPSDMKLIDYEDSYYLLYDLLKSREKKPSGNTFFGINSFLEKIFDPIFKLFLPDDSRKEYTLPALPKDTEVFKVDSFLESSGKKTKWEYLFWN